MRWRWPHWLRWRSAHDRDHAKQARAAAEARLRAAQRDRRQVEAASERLANLPPDEYADRVAAAFRRPPWSC